MKYVGRWTAERMQREQDHERNAPVALLEMLREEDGARELFDGLMLHYLKSLGRDRLDVWAKAAHAVIDLLAHPALEVHKRNPPPSDYISDRVFDGCRHISVERVAALKRSFERQVVVSHEEDRR